MESQQIEELKQFRCRFCNRLLAKIGSARLIEIKCPKCKQLNQWVEVPPAEEAGNGKEDR